MFLATGAQALQLKTAVILGGCAWWLWWVIFGDLREGSQPYISEEWLIDLLMIHDG